MPVAGLIKGPTLALAGRCEREVTQLPDKHLIDIRLIGPLYQEGHNLCENLRAWGSTAPEPGLNDTAALQVPRATPHSSGREAEALGNVDGGETLFP